jgi:hypothetical protein
MGYLEEIEMSKRTTLFGICAVLSLASISQAAVEVVVQSESIAASATNPTTGFFDVYVDVTSTGNPSLLGWQAKVIADAGNPSGLTLNPPATITDGGVSPRTMLLGDANFHSPNGAEVDTSSHVSGTQFASNSAVPLDGTVDEGLMRVPFTLAAGAHGTFTIDLDVNGSDAAGTLLADGNGDPIPFTAINGVLTVTVPEPASMSLMAMGLGGLLIRRRSAAV